MLSSSRLETSSDVDSISSAKTSARYHEHETSGRKHEKKFSVHKKLSFSALPPIAHSSSGHDKCPEKCMLAHAEKHLASARSSKRKWDSDKHLSSARSSKKRIIPFRTSTSEGRVELVSKVSQRRSVFPTFIDMKSEITEAATTVTQKLDTTTITEELPVTSGLKSSTSPVKVSEVPRVPTFEYSSGTMTETTATTISDVEESEEENKTTVAETLTSSTTGLASLQGTRRGPSIKDELLGISLPGVSQAMAAHNILNRIIWFILFGVSCGLLTWNLFFLYSQYRETPYNPEIKVQDAKFVFPDFFICHSIIPSVSIINYHLKTDPDGMHKMFQRMHELEVIAKEVRHNLSALAKELPETKKYWINKNDRLALSILLSSFWDHYNPLRRFKNPREQTIINAYVNERKLALTDFEIIPHQEFYSCLKFRNSSLLKSKNNGITLYLYLDESQLFTMRPDHLDLLDVSFAGYRVDDKSEGFELIFSSGEHYPGNSELVLKASPGTVTRIFIKMEEIKFKSRANYPCQEKGLTFAFANHIDRSKPPISYQLDYYQCFSYQWTLILFEKCRCVEIFNNLPNKIVKEAHYCQNATRYSPYQISQNIVCGSTLWQAESTTNHIRSECQKILPCNFKRYKSTSSFGTWPTVAHTEKFVKHVMEPNYKERTARGLLLPAWKNVLDAGKRMPDMVRANVAKVDIYPASSRGMLIQDKEAYPIFNFLSDIGGVFGLYLDVSFLTLCVVFQALYRIYKICKHAHFRRFAIRDIPQLLSQTVTTE